MSNPKNNKDLFDFLTKIYKSSVKKSLEIPKEEVSDAIEKLLDLHASKHNLSTNSSINPVKYYHMKSRVKGEDSFSEKLIRKDIGLIITNKYGNGIKDLTKERVSIINDLKKLDDIIGIRVVTELKEDCHSIYKILRDNLSSLQEKEIEFHDMDEQPQTMKNGLDIYRVKGTYQDHICFELQIKSKIDEAWGEMDHTIFYKAHTISPIKDTVQLTMNNVGHLLEKIENLLFDLRESDKKFEANTHYNAFQNRMSNELSEKLRDIFGASIDLKEYTKSLYFIKNKILKSNKSIDNKSITFDHLNYEITKDHLKYFVEARNKSHKLTITESIFYNILKTQNPAFILDQKNYNDSFNSFYSYYKEFLSSEIMEIEIFEKLLTDNEKFIDNPELYTNPQKLEKFAKIREHIVNTLEDHVEGQKILLNLFFINRYSGNTKLFLEKTIDNLDFDLSERLLYLERLTKELDDFEEKKEWLRETQQFLKVIKTIQKLD